LVEFGASTLAELVDAVSGRSGTPGTKSSEASKAQTIMEALSQGLHHRVVSLSRAEAVPGANGARSRPGTVRYEVKRRFVDGYLVTCIDLNALD
jgi:hypothetical protein